jgi:hypothetical protein
MELGQQPVVTQTFLSMVYNSCSDVRSVFTVAVPVRLNKGPRVSGNKYIAL